MFFDCFDITFGGGVLPVQADFNCFEVVGDSVVPLALKTMVDVSVIAPTSPPRPKLDFTSPTMPPNQSAEIAPSVIAPTLPPNPPKALLEIDVAVTGPTLPPRPL